MMSHSVMAKMTQPEKQVFPVITSRKFSTQYPRVIKITETILYFTSISLFRNNLNKMKNNVSKDCAPHLLEELIIEKCIAIFRTRFSFPENVLSAFKC